MLTLAFIRENPDRVRQAIRERRDSADIDLLLRLDAERRDLTVKADDLKRERNESSRKIGRREVEGDEMEALKARMGGIGDEIRTYDARISTLDVEIQDLLWTVPNIPDPSVPVGQSEDDNAVVKEWGSRREFDFEPKGHDEIGAALGIFETRAAVKMSGTRFHTLSGMGARLQRALGEYMLDVHVNRHGFEEMYVPFLVKREAMIISAQLPKFEEDAYHVERDEEDMFLIPTGEVPLVNMLAGETVDVSRLPVKYATLSPCFRREAGAAGRDTRGMIRVHQFMKVELVMFTEPERSSEALDSLLRYAEVILEELGLPYHVLLMNTSDLGFGHIKKFDPEVWMPAQAVYREISSASNMGDFQSRRGNIRYSTPGEKPRLVHTLNASGLAIGRTLAALLENYQQVDGSVELPSVLGPYLGGNLVMRPLGPS